jgi:hypothetical protein
MANNKDKKEIWFGVIPASAAVCASGEMKRVACGRRESEVMCDAIKAFSD